MPPALDQVWVQWRLKPKLQMVANNGKRPALTKKPPTSLTMATEVHGVPCHDPCRHDTGPTGFVIRYYLAAVFSYANAYLLNRSSLELAILQLQTEMREIVQEMDNLKEKRRKTRPARQHPHQYEVEKVTRDSKGGKTTPLYTSNSRTPRVGRARKTTPGSLPLSKMEGIWRTRMRKRHWKRQRSAQGDL